MHRISRYLLWVFLTFLVACSSKPQDILFGVEECAHCRMTVSDPRFAAQLQTPHGRVYSFDSVECLAQYIQENGLQNARHFVYTYMPPNQRISADSAFFLKSEGLSSPMGDGLSAYTNASDAESQQYALGGQVYTWNRLLIEYQPRR